VRKIQMREGEEEERGGAWGGGVGHQGRAGRTGPG
jgi:hypothetical protein